MDILKTRTCVLLAVLLISLQPAWGQSREYKLKAAFIYNFIKFVEWPSDSGTIKVGVFGKNPFQGELKKLETKKVGSRAIKVAAVSSLSEAKGYQVVFVSDSAQAKQLVKAVEGSPVLTVSDLPNFSKDGGGIGLVSSKNRIRFSINTTSLKKASLRASSKLLGLAAKIDS